MSTLVRTWGRILGVAGLLAGLGYWSQRPPAPLPADASSERFAAGRARRVIDHLCLAIGRHPAGSVGAEQAAAWLASELRTLPRIEVEVQNAEGVFVFEPQMVVAYRVRNVVARIPGRQPTAVLVSAHYDSADPGLGAADDAKGVAALMELARVLTAGPPLEHTVVLNLNGGEERALVGAHGFLGHRWFKDVRVFVNVDTAAGGKALMLQAGAADPALLRAYARAAPAPLASVLTQDLYQRGLLPHTDDSRVYRSPGGVPGLVFTSVGDLWANHTRNDVPARDDPGSIQHVGDTVLAVVQELARGPLPNSPGQGQTSYYDVAGQALIVYGRSTARLLSALAALLAACALGVVIRRGRRRLRHVVGATVMAALTLVGGGVTAVLPALLLSYGLQRRHGWFATPWLAPLTFGALAVAGALAVQAAWRWRALRRGVDPADLADTAWAGVVALFGCVAALTVWWPVGSAYLALWWAGPAALGLGLAAVRPAWRGAGLLLAGLPGATLTLGISISLARVLIPDSARLPFPMDAPLAALMAVTVLLPLLIAAVPLQRAGGLGRAALVFAAVGLAGLTGTALRFPYTPERPKLLYVAHTGDERTGVLVMNEYDAIDPRPALAGVPGLQLSQRQLDRIEWSYEAPAAPLTGPAPRLTVRGSQYDPARDVRTVTLQIDAAAADAVWLKVPAAALAGWSLTDPLPLLPAGYTDYRVSFVAVPQGGREVTLRLRGQVPVSVWFWSYDTAQTTPDLDALQRQLPAWVSPELAVVHQREIRM